MINYKIIKMISKTGVISYKYEVHIEKAIKEAEKEIRKQEKILAKIKKIVNN